MVEAAVVPANTGTRAPDAAQRVALREAVLRRAGAVQGSVFVTVPALRSGMKNAAPRPGHVSGVRRDDGRGSISELFAQDSLFQAVAGIEQHAHRNGLVRNHLDAADIARLVVV